MDMKPKKSPLQQTEFVVLESSVKVYLPEDARELDLCDIPVSIDFEVLEQESIDPSTFRIILELKGNESESVPGYKFELTVGGEYHISEEITPGSPEFIALVQSSALACLINESRVYLQTITAFLPFGSYILPMVDLNDLVQQKKKIS